MADDSLILENISDLISVDLLVSLKSSYAMQWNGLHGFSHWRRVRENGLRLAAETGADPKIIEYFAFFHDNQRHNDGFDWEHGERASLLIQKEYAGRLNLTGEEFKILCEACAGHNRGATEAEISIQTCWDADRLDLMRVGIMPDPKYLCTEAARRKDTLDWAVERSLVWRKEYRQSDEPR